MTTKQKTSAAPLAEALADEQRASAGVEMARQRHEHAEPDEAPEAHAALLRAEAAHRAAVRLREAAEVVAGGELRAARMHELEALVVQADGAVCRADVQAMADQVAEHVASIGELQRRMTARVEGQRAAVEAAGKLAGELDTTSLVDAPVPTAYPVAATWTARARGERHDVVALVRALPDSVGAFADALLRLLGLGESVPAGWTAAEVIDAIADGTFAAERARRIRVETARLKALPAGVADAERCRDCGSNHPMRSACIPRPTPAEEQRSRDIAKFSATYGPPTTSGGRSVQ